MPNKLCLQSIRIPLPCEPYRCVKDEFDEEHSRMVLTFERNPDSPAPACPYCGEQQSVHCRREVSLLGPRIGLARGSVWKVRFAVRKCKECDSYSSDPIPFRFGRTSVTTELAKEICDDLSTASSIKAVAQRYGVSWDIVRNVHRKALEMLKAREPVPPKVRIASVDEFSVEKGHRYATFVIDAETKYPLYLHRGKSEEDFRPFFSAYAKAWYGSIEAFSMDQNAQYASVVSEELPSCAVVCDFFHIIKNYTDQVIEPIRKSMARRAGAAGDSLLVKIAKGAKRLLQKGLHVIRTEADMDAKLALSRLMEENHDLDVCLHLRDELKAIYDTSPNAEVMEQRWHLWCDTAVESGIAELSEFVRKKRKREQEIINHGDFHVSSGVIEGCMNRIKVLKRVSYGFRDWDYFFLRIWWEFLPDGVRKELYDGLWEDTHYISNYNPKEEIA